MTQLLPNGLEGRGVELVTHFASREPAVFSAAEAAQLLALSPLRAYDLLSRLVKRGWLVRHRNGVFEVAPLWASPTAPYAPERFAALAGWLKDPYYVGFLSALELRGWIGHPVLNRVWIAVPGSRHPLRSSVDRITWVVLLPDRFAWGLAKHWIGERALMISDPERTILDCVHLSRHAGGITEVAGALARAWPSLDPKRLVGYVDRLGIEAVRRRLGLLLETVPLKGGRDLAVELGRVASYRTPILLDPSLPIGGEVDRRWGVRLNVELAEIEGAGQT